MRDRIRRCVECPRCLTRYLVAFSPYRNGSYVVSTVAGFPEASCILCCSCRKPAQDRGYGMPDEIVLEAESHGMRAHLGQVQPQARNNAERLPESPTHD
jgi:hypothetical protein